MHKIIVENMLKSASKISKVYLGCLFRQEHSYIV